MKVSAKPDSGFGSDPSKYAAYLETPEGRLRLDLAFANLQEFLAQEDSSLVALDLGCGTGAAAVRLARLGVQVTLLDSSQAMLDLAERAAQEAGVARRVIPKLGDAARLADLLPNGLFDIVLCHNLLEYVDDPAAVLCDAARLMRGPSAILSVLVRNQAGEVLKAALQGGDLAAAERGLGAEWGRESLYGGKVRLFRLNALEPMLNQASLTIMAHRGVRVITDYLPAQISRTADYERILALERKLGNRGEFASVARYRQYLTRRSRPVVEDGA